MDIIKFQKATATSVAVAQKWFDLISASASLYNITTDNRMAMYLAQIGHESLSFSLTHELWGPTPQQLKYEPPSTVAASLGNTQKGDGFLFKGRGLIQITGRANYAAISKVFELDFIATPEALEIPGLAAQSAAWWWNEHGCNEAADAGTPEAFTRVTRIVNGGTTGILDRVNRWNIAKGALNVK